MKPHEDKNENSTSKTILRLHIGAEFLQSFDVIVFIRSLICREPKIGVMNLINCDQSQAVLGVFEFISVIIHIWAN